MQQFSRQPALPERIGRYDILRLLGRGGQGIVMLARDGELDRQVAIKLLRRDPDRTEGTLASEARIVSRLQHPNIVTLHDVGTFQGCNYLVFEYIDGDSLKALIEADGALPLDRCVILMSQILAGVAYLHENNIIHRDLSPANILINRDGVPKVTDFGISVLHDLASAETETNAAGTLRYMAPEPFLDLFQTPASDVFTLAVIFYEMLTGRRLFDGDTANTIINGILHGEPLDAIAVGGAVDARVVRVLNRATQRRLDDRYPTAREMKTELDEFRLPRGDAAGTATQDHSTVAFLLRRMTHAKGFSSLSRHVGQLLEITAEDSLTPATRLVNIIAKDVTLTQRVLTMANSAFYGRSEIADLPRAVVLLGIEQMRSCIISALLESEFEAGSAALRDALTVSFHSAVVARSIAAGCGLRNRAEAFTCAMFHDLGRLLTMHYFGEEHAAILAHAVRVHSDELTASRHVLGIAYHELGAAVGRHWKLGELIVGAMRPLPRGEVAPSDDDAARMAVCAAYANAVSRAIADHADAGQRDEVFAELARKTGSVLALDPADFSAALQDAAEVTANYARMIGISATSSAVVARLTARNALAGAA
ncbi:MAG: protein kinase [Gammaproteobacteria bacterium]